MGQVTSRFRFLFTSSKPQEILMVGLDAVGKTTILYMLKNNEQFPTVPTIGFNIEECKVGNTKLKIWDVGGQPRIRHLWSEYSKSATGFVYVIDITLTEKYQESADHLEKVLEGKTLPVLILLNKKDMLDSEKEIEKRKSLILSLLYIDTDKTPFKVFCVSAIKDDNDPERAYMDLEQAFMWLNTAIQKNS